VENGRYFSVPADTVTELFCDPGAACLAFVRSAGPPTLHYLHEQAAPVP
jgi:hypothetical protein